MDGVSTFVPKKYLSWTYRELAKLVKNEPDELLNHIKSTTLYSYIKSKKEFVGITKIPQTSCLCPTCEILEPAKIVQTTMIYLNNYDDILEQLRDTEQISFYRWQKGNKYEEKALKEATGIEAAELLTKVVANLKVHYFNKRVQSKKYKDMIDNIKQGEVVIQRNKNFSEKHVDYSEN